ncbi:MAG: GlxA family transcriptional regulator [Thermodesulfobacteriota bacterium]
MQKVVVLALDNTLASTVMGPMDIFSQAGVLYNRIVGADPRPMFSVAMATVDGKPVRCSNGAVLVPEASITDIERADIVVISAEDLEIAGRSEEAVVPWLRSLHASGAKLCSVCTGAFLLARTGLLDGKRATTHWAFAELFRQRFPRVHLRPEAMITDEGSVICGGGAHSYFDLCLYLVEQSCGFETAGRCARALLLSMGRSSQLPYAIFEYQKKHGDPVILKAQNLMEESYSENLSVERMAGTLGMSPRNFKRRFKTATGDSPLSYLQRYRVEAAKRMAEQTQLSVAEIAAAVGYEDAVFFRALFKRHTGLTPNEYRLRFRRAAA